MGMKLILFILLAILSVGILTAFFLFNDSSPQEISSQKYLGMAMNQKYDYPGFGNYLLQYDSNFNIVVLPLWIDNDKTVSSGLEDALNKVGEYDLVGLMILHIEQKLVDMNVNERGYLYEDIKSTPGFSNIDFIALDEPYLKGFTEKELEEAIAEISQAFPNKKIAVNFAKSGLSGKKIPHEKIDYVGFDSYPCTINKQEWIGEIQSIIDLIKSKSDKPILFVTQGFSKDSCPLTKEKIQWAYDISEKNNIKGLVFWFPEEEMTDPHNQEIYKGFSNSENSEIKNKILNLSF